MGIRRIGTHTPQAERFIQFNLRQDYAPDDGQAIHVQARGESVNRDYGAAANIPFDSELGRFLAALRQSAALPVVPSLAGTGKPYNRLNVRRNGDAFIFEGTVETTPYAAWEYVQGNTIQFEVDRYDLPSDLIEALD